jgi:hypothetical protein
VTLVERPPTLAERAMALLQKLPSTNARIAVTIILWGLTGLAEVVMFLVSRSWSEIPLVWAGLLVTMSGLDSATFLGKRSTHADYVKAKKGP